MFDISSIGNLAVSVQGAFTSVANSIAPVVVGIAEQSAQAISKSAASYGVADAAREQLAKFSPQALGEVAKAAISLG